MENIHRILLPDSEKENGINSVTCDKDDLIMVLSLSAVKQSCLEETQMERMLFSHKNSFDANSFLGLQLKSGNFKMMIVSYIREPSICRNPFTSILILRFSLLTRHFVEHKSILSNKFYTTGARSIV